MPQIRIPPEHWGQVWRTLVASGPVSRVSEEPVYVVTDEQLCLLRRKRLPLELLSGRIKMMLGQFHERIPAMVVITFPDKETQKKALGFLLGRFSGKVLKNGEHIVPEAALAALADKNIPFTVHGRAVGNLDGKLPDRH